MPRPKKTPAAPAPPMTQPIAPSKTSHLFAPRKSNDRAAITHERLAADMDAFLKGGGKIEVLGVTRALLRIGNDADAPPPAAAVATPTKTRR